LTQVVPYVSFWQKNVNFVHGGIPRGHNITILQS